jgi:hypothetical protein
VVSQLPPVALGGPGIDQQAAGLMLRAAHSLYIHQPLGRDQGELGVMAIS